MDKKVSRSRKIRQETIFALMALGILQIKHVWRFFMLVYLGMIVAVLLACSLPLFSYVSKTASIRNVFNDGFLDPTTSIQITASIASSQAINEITQTVTQSYQETGGAFFPSMIRSFQPDKGNVFQNGIRIPAQTLQLHGYDNSHIASHLQLIQGHLPQLGSNGNKLEIALSALNAQKLHAHIGSTYTIYLTPLDPDNPQSSVGTLPIQLTLIGIFQEVSYYDPFWHGDSLTTFYDPVTHITNDNAVISNTALLQMYDRWIKPGYAVYLPTKLNYYFPLNTQAVTSDNLTTLQQQLNNSASNAPYMSGYGFEVTSTNNDLLTLVNAAQGQDFITQNSAFLMAALMFGLILLFIGIMTELLVARQAEAVALSRVRGATLFQIFLTFISQSLLLSLLTLLVTPILILPIVRVLVQLLFPVSDQGALNVLPTNPWDVALFLGWYLVAAVGITVVVMCVAVWRTLKSNTLGRSVTLVARPFWQRFYLDLLLALLAGLTYILYLYFGSTGLINPQTQILLAEPCMLVIALLLCVALTLFSLRYFPWLVRLGSRLAMRQRGIVPLLPFVQIARSPRQATRTSLLVVMTIAFTLFTLVFMATQQQHISDLATYRAGADFKGFIPSEALPDTSSIADISTAMLFDQGQLQQKYQQVAGVLSATVGYTADYNYDNNNDQLSVLAIDPANFASSANWLSSNTTYTTQTLSQQLANLEDQRRRLSTLRPAADGSYSSMPALPAIVDAATAQRLQLSVGKRFTIMGYDGQITLVDIGELEYIPGINDALSWDVGGQAGIMVDYQSFVHTYEYSLPSSSDKPVPNMLWVHNQQDAVSSSKVRHALTTGPLALESLSDQQELLQALQHDPTYLDILLMLILGLGLCLLLMLVGNITSIWLAVRNRLRSLVMLRALGMVPRQLMSVLAWEQGIIAVFALVVGVLCGIVFLVVALPSVVFSGLAQTGSPANAATSHIYQLQFAPPLRIAVSPLLLIALVGVVVVFLASLALTTYTASRPSMSQTLRLDDDYVEDMPLFVARTEQPLKKAVARRRPLRRQQQRTYTEQEPRSARLTGDIVLSRMLTPVRRVWSYLSLTALGIIVSVVLICVVPLFSLVTETAGMRSVLAQPGNQYATTSTNDGFGIVLESASQQFISTKQSLDRTFFRDAGSFFHDPGIALLRGSVSQKTSDGQTLQTAESSLSLIGLSSSALPAHVRIIQGQMPQQSGKVLQIALTPAGAAALHVHVGTLLTPKMGYLLTMQVVGIFQPRSANDIFIPSTSVFPSTVLVSTEAFMQASAAHTLATSGRIDQFGGEIDWYYRINSNTITINQFNDMVGIFSTLATINTSTSTSISLPIDAFSQYQESMQISQVPIVTISVLIVGLILLFLSFMTELLVEQESRTIAVLSSRGATQQQIFAAFMSRMFILSGIGMLIGLFLVIPTLMVLIHFTLSSTDQSMVHLVTDQPILALLGIYPYILGCIAITLLALVLALYRAFHINTLKMRLEISRSTRKPFWQRFYLDVVGLIVALGAYGFSLYLTNVGILDAQLSVLLRSPLVLTATVCFLMACVLVFQRIFPWLLQVGATIVAGRKNVEPMLALSQMARTPRPVVRIVLLLLITTALVVFMSIFAVSQNQHVSDVAQYWTGADFSGQLLKSAPEDQVSSLQSAYRHVPGVTSVTTGIVTSQFQNDSTLTSNVSLIATDPTSFLQTVKLSGIDTSQKKQNLIAQLKQPNNEIIIPAVVDKQFWDDMQLTQSEQITLNGPFPMYFQVVGEVDYIPSSNDGQQFSDGATGPTFSMLVDYQNYVDVYDYRILHMAPIEGQSFAAQPLAKTNYVWLNTKGDAQTLARVRKAVNTGRLQLQPLSDRYATIQQLQNDPLTHNLIGILILGAIAPLVLTWIGCLLASWVNIRERFVHFGVLRALGSTLGQLARTIAWEQILVYGAAILLGTLFGFVMALLSLPSLVLTSTIPASSASSVQNLFLIQNIPPSRIVLAPSLAMIIGIIVLLGILTVVLMYRAVSRMMLAQTLRLNQD